MMARPEWFDTEHRVIHMQQSESWQTKNKKNRVIPMTREFQRFLVEIYGLRSRTGFTMVLRAESEIHALRVSREIFCEIFCTTILKVVLRIKKPACTPE